MGCTTNVAHYLAIDYLSFILNFVGTNPLIFLSQGTQSPQSSSLISSKIPISSTSLTSSIIALLVSILHKRDARMPSNSLVVFSSNQISFPRTYDLKISFSFLFWYSFESSSMAGEQLHSFANPLNFNQFLFSSASLLPSTRFFSRENDLSSTKSRCLCWNKGCFAKSPFKF